MSGWNWSATIACSEPGSRFDMEAGELIVAFEEREVAYGFGELDEVVLAL